MYYEYYNSEFGLILIEASDQYLISIKIINDKEYNEKLIKDNYITNECILQLKEYFNMERDYFDLPIEFNDSFAHRILKALYSSEYGTTLSYKELGALIDSKAYQAIGSVMKNNRLPIIIPCHRVIKNDGSLGNYYYGSKMKEALLLIEYRYLFKMNIQHLTYFSNEEIDKIKKHPILNKMFKTMPIVNSYYQFKDVFTCLVCQVIYQQVAFKTALKQESMLAKLCNYQITREVLNNIDDKELIKIGLNGPRLRYIRNLIEYDFDYNLLYNMNEIDIYNTLIKIKGIGSWTIEMTLLFALNKKDIISYKDLIIINSLKHLYRIDDLSITTFNNLIKEYHGYESIVSMNLWPYMEQGYYLNVDK